MNPKKTQIQCIAQACDELSIPFLYLDNYKNVLSIMRGGRQLFFVQSTTPFNSQDVVRVAKDKYYTYLAVKDVINHPKSHVYLNPFVDKKYAHYIEFPSFQSIAEDIQIQYPEKVILKPNSGSMGYNVFTAQNSDELIAGVSTILDPHNRHYDHLLLAQEFVDIIEEYRVVVHNRTVELVYRKDETQVESRTSLSPLHNVGARAVHVDSEQIIHKLQEFILPLFDALPIDYCGLDIAIDAKGNFVLIEVNASPGFDIFLRDNDETIIIEMYKRILLA